MKTSNRYQLLTLFLSIFALVQLRTFTDKQNPAQSHRHYLATVKKAHHRQNQSPSGIVSSHTLTDRITIGETDLTLSINIELYQQGSFR